MVTEHFVSLKEGTHYYHVHTWSHVFKSAKKLLSSIDALFSDLTTFYSLLFPLKTESNTRKTEKYCLLCRQYYAIQNSTTFIIIIFQSPTLVTGISVQARISFQGGILVYRPELAWREEFCSKYKKRVQGENWRFYS